MVVKVGLNVHCVVLSARHVVGVSTYSTCRDNCQEVLKQMLGARYAEFKRFSIVEKMSYVLDSKN